MTDVEEWSAVVHPEAHVCPQHGPEEWVRISVFRGECAGDHPEGGACGLEFHPEHDGREFPTVVEALVYLMDYGPAIAGEE